MKIKNPLLRMAANGVLGAALGLVSGMLLGLAIFYVQELLCYLGSLNIDEAAKGYSSTYRCYNSFSNTTFLGIGAGTIIGAIMGSIVGIKKTK